jgi:hypothetical protein
MAQYDSKPDRTVVVSSGASGAGWFIVGALVVALVGGLWLYSNGYFGNDADINVKIDLPKIETPAK